MMNHEQFLALAGELGITIVGIGDTRHPLLGNESFPHHHPRQIFTPVEQELEQGDDFGIWGVDYGPAAWILAKKAGIYGGCGNSGQCQADTTGLRPGVWVRLVDGDWGRVA